MRESRNNQLSPFRTQFGEQIGIGTSNIVRAVEPDSRQPGLPAGKLVVKISHRPKGSFPDELRPKPAAAPTSRPSELSAGNERVFQGTLYKKKKYEILKTFLGDFIPDSSFVLGHKKDGEIRPKEYTVQQRVPQSTIAELSPEQRRDPRLLRQMFVLLVKLQNMYRVLGQVDQVVHPQEPSDSLDAKLDLGGISGYAKEHLDDDPNVLNITEIVDGFQNSPNLLVDPESLQLYCVDFDEGTWNDTKEAAKIVAEHLVAEDPQAQAAIAMNSSLPPQQAA
jgi:hypothetical protein